MGKTTIKRMSVMLGIVLALGGIIYVALGFLAKAPSPEKFEAEIKTGGSSSVYFAIDKWRNAYKKEKGIFVDYISKGSSEGIALMIDKKIDIGFTHAPMTDEQRSKAKEKGGEVVHIPVLISAIVPIYNLRELKNKIPLNFTGEVLAKIFLGDIKTWDNDELLAINPELQELKKDGKLPATKIVVVHRKDKSGTTYIFTDYLQDVSQAWRAKFPQAKDEITWPVGEGAERSTGVAELVAATDGAIGYVEVLHARAKNIPSGKVENKDSIAKKEFKDKVFLQAKPKNITAAAENIGKIPDDLTFSLINKPGAESYPLCAASWAVCYQNQPASRQKLVTDFLYWVTHEGQKPAYNNWTYDSRGTTNAAAFLTNGAVSQVNVLKTGIVYTSKPRVKISGGGGKDAYAVAKLSDKKKDLDKDGKAIKDKDGKEIEIEYGEIVSIDVVQDPDKEKEGKKLPLGGSGYTSPPLVTIVGETTPLVIAGGKQNRPGTDPRQQEPLFAELPKELVDKIEQRLQTIKSVQ